MNNKSDHIWMAYLDNELTASEVSDFEDTLSSDEKKRLEKEKQFETEISSKLPDIKCPEQVWDNIMGDISGLGKKRSNLMKFAALSGIAALVALSFLIVFGQLVQDRYPVLKQVSSLAALNQEVEISGEDPSRVQSLLKSYGFDLDISTIPKEGHKIKLLGAYSSPCCCGGKVVALCFDCCGEPVRLVVMKDGTDFVKCCECGCKDGTIQTLVKKGPYRIAVIGNHRADELLNLLQLPVVKKNASIDYGYERKLFSKLF